MHHTAIEIIEKEAALDTRICLAYHHILSKCVEEVRNVEHYFLRHRNTKLKGRFPHIRTIHPDLHLPLGSCINFSAMLSFYWRIYRWLKSSKPYPSGMLYRKSLCLHLLGDFIICVILLITNNIRATLIHKQSTKLATKHTFPPHKGLSLPQSKT